jgi:hypothetical protein
VGEESRMGRGEGATREPVVEPKGSSSAVANGNIGEGAVSIHFVVDNSPQVAVSGRDGRVERGSLTKKPRLPVHIFS